MKRFDCETDYQAGIMIEYDDGEYVRFEDVEHIGEWISVDDQLPPPYQHFLALNRNGYIFESCMCYGMHEPWFTYPRGDGNASNTAPSWIDVTHWMPLPDEPK